MQPLGDQYKRYLRTSIIDGLNYAREIGFNLPSVERDCGITQGLLSRFMKPENENKKLISFDGMLAILSRYREVMWREGWPVIDTEVEWMLKQPAIVEAVKRIQAKSGKG